MELQREHGQSMSVVVLQQAMLPVVEPIGSTHPRLLLGPATG